MKREDPLDPDPIGNLAYGERGAITAATIRMPGAKPDTATLAALDRLLGWLRQEYKEDSWISV